MRAAEADQRVEGQRRALRARDDPEYMYVTHDPPGNPALPHEEHTNAETEYRYDPIAALYDAPLQHGNILYPCCGTPECGGERIDSSQC